MNGNEKVNIKKSCISFNSYLNANLICIIELGGEKMDRSIKAFKTSDTFVN